MKFKSFLLALLLLPCLIAGSLLLSGCAIDLPSQFASTTPPLSTNDQNIVKACVAVRNSLPEIEIGVATATPLILNATTKQASTLIRVGGFTNLLGHVLIAAGNGTSLSPTIVNDSAGSLNTSLSPAEQQIATSIISNAQAAYAALYSHALALADSASDPSVKTYALKTAALAAAAIGQGLVDSTEQYTPTAL